MVCACYPTQVVTKPRLSADDWVQAGLNALSEVGPDAVALESLATKLGTTKGSGYWHWKSRRALLKAVLERWREVATESVLDLVEADGGSPEERLARLLRVVTARLDESPGEMQILAHTDPDVRAVVTKVTDRRIDYVAELLRAGGHPVAEAQRRAVIAYAAYLGYATLSASVPDVLPESEESRRAMQRTLAELLTSRHEGPQS
jgi:AcrR family transcriptional regulator